MNCAIISNPYLRGVISFIHKLIGHLSIKRIRIYLLFSYAAIQNVLVYVIYILFFESSTTPAENKAMQASQI